MSIEINQEKLIVPEIEGSTPIEVSPEITDQKIEGVKVTPLENISQAQIPNEESVGKEGLSSKVDSPVILQTGAGDGSGWVMLLESKEEGGEIEVL